MNAQGRKELKDILDLLNDAKERIEQLKGEEEEKYDNLPEGLQQTERGQAIETAKDNLESAYDDLESVIGYVESAME